MAEIIRFGLSNDEYLQMARKAFDEGDVVLSITTLKNLLKKHGRFFEASIALSQAYSSIGVFERSNSVLFKALSLHPQGEIRDSIYLQLTTNFFDERKLDVAEYYLRDIAEKFNLQLPDIDFEEFEPTNNKFRVVYPKGDDYYQSLIEKAYSLIHERKFDEAILLLDEIDARSKVKKSADHIALVALMMKEDIDGVIENAIKILDRDPDNLSAKCTLATAYLMEEKPIIAHAILDKILESEYTSSEDMLMVLHLLVNMEEHAEIVKYTKKLLNLLNYQPHVMIWLSEALYNIGQKEEAKRLMHKVKVIFGDKFPGEYLLALYNKNPDSVPYSMGMPYSQRIEYRKSLERFFKLEESELKALLDCDDNNSISTKKLIKQVYVDDDERIKLAVTEKLFSVESDYVEEIVKDQLISTSLSFELMSRLMCYLLDDEKKVFKFCVVAQDRFKDVFLHHPMAFSKMPKMLESAYVYCLADIVYTDEEQNYYLDRLRAVIDSLCYVDEKGKCKFYEEKRARIARLKSLPTLVAVILAKVYEEEDDSLENTIERYNIDVATFDRYFKIVFGD